MTRGRVRAGAHASRALVLALTLVVAGCAATSTTLGKRQLDVQTKMSDTIFLDPVTANRQTIYVQVRNTSDKPDFDIEQEVKAAIAARGYRVVDDPAAAHYMLQANILQAGKSSPTAAEQSLAGGFGSVLFGGAVGAAAGRAAGGETETIIAGALIGAATETVTGSFVKDVTYSITTDIQVSERSAQGVVVTESMHQNLAQGSSGSRVIASSEVTDWKRYRTRVISIANQANLEFEDAAPQLVTGLTRSISGIF